MKILLLNPPGKNLYIRDYYCSKISQANYISHPVDLLVISGNLRTLRDCEVFLVDAVVEKLTVIQALSAIKEIGPEYIISLIGSVSLDEDLEFLKSVKEHHSCRIIGTGDVLQENPGEYLEKTGIFDAVVTDFTTQEITKYIASGSSEKKILSSDGSGDYALAGNPRHELFLELKYRYPFTLSRKYCSVLTEFGCPFKCSFCIMGKLKYKSRPVENIINELEYIKSLGVNEVFFVDQTFNSNKKKTFQLLNEMITRKLNISWFSFSRVDVLDEETLGLMKKSGCHTLILGIESGSDKILKEYRKGYSREDIRRTLKICSKLGIRTTGTFIFGLPDETPETAAETLSLIKELPLDYASFNVAVPRAGTDLRRQALSLGLIDKDFQAMDQSGTSVAMSTKQMPRGEIKKIRKQAVMAFYLRPSYLLKRIAHLRTFHELAQNISNACHLLGRTFGKNED